MLERRLIDSSLRDGEQSPFVFLTPFEKVKIAEKLDNIGIYQIEAGISATGKEEKNTILKILENKKQALISIWSRLTIEDAQNALDCTPDILHLSIPVSDLHIYTKMSKDREWIMQQLSVVLETVANKEVKISIGFEDATRADLSFMVNLLSILNNYSIEMVRLADTVGSATPFTIRETITSLKNFTQIPFGIHTHNDLGMAVANTAEALKAGALYADTTILGVGERAGNCNLHDLIRLTEKLIDFGVDSTKINVLEKNFNKIINSHKKI